MVFAGGSVVGSEGEGLGFKGKVRPPARARPRPSGGTEGGGMGAGMGPRLKRGAAGSPACVSLILTNVVTLLCDCDCDCDCGDEP